MAPLRFNTQEDQIVIGRDNLLLPASIVTGAVIIAFSLGMFYFKITSDLQSMKEGMWTRNQMRQYNYELSANAGLHAPDVDGIAGKIH